MPEIFATPGAANANSYLTLEDADTAMDGYPNAKKWANLDEATKQRILLEGTRKIDRFKNWTPLDDVQRLAFPTSLGEAGVVPTPVLTALLEFCDFKAGGELESLKRLQAEGVTSRSLMGQSSQFSADDSQLPAGCRRELDGLWRLYSAPRLVQQPYRRAGSASPTTESAFGPECPPIDRGGLGEI